MANWKQVEGFPSYEASDDGRVRALGRFVRNTLTSVRWIPPNERKPQKHPGGYRQISLSKDNCCRSHFIHILVARAFVSGYAPGLEVNHINGDKADNRAENLEWCTRQANIDHAENVLRKRPRGERHGNAKLTTTDVLAIRQSSDSRTALARRFGVTNSAIDQIINRKGWTHI
jgi:hypothetical protein